MSRVVLVAGAGRSGTSTIAGALSMLGLHLPEPQVPADDTNPRGFYETQWVVDFHKAMLKRSPVVRTLDSRPEAPELARSLPTPSDAAELDEQRRIGKASHGMSVVALRRKTVGQPWTYTVGHHRNRRITADTPFTVTGPVAGSAALRTKADPKGTTILGTLGNCAGGTTPWGTVLACEENFDQYFANVQAVTDPTVRALHDRIDFDEGPSQRRWELHHPRFDLAREPHEPFRRQLARHVVELAGFDGAEAGQHRQIVAGARAKLENAGICGRTDDAFDDRIEDPPPRSEPPMAAVQLCHLVENLAFHQSVPIFSRTT